MDSGILFTTGDNTKFDTYVADAFSEPTNINFARNIDRCFHFVSSFNHNF